MPLLIVFFIYGLNCEMFSGLIAEFISLSVFWGSLVSICFLSAWTVKVYCFVSFGLWYTRTLKGLGTWSSLLNFTVIAF